MRFKIFIIFVALYFISLQLAAQKANMDNISNHLAQIVETEEFRNYRQVETLNKIADYIYAIFSQYADTTYFQKYQVNKKGYQNVIAVFNKQGNQTIVVGAHYDVCGDQSGADDNASGVVGILELARMLKHQPLDYRIELVAFTLEEPPFFDTKHMGSYQHAKQLADNKVDVYGMLSLDMIGYFKEEKKTQTYPLRILSLFNGSKGNFMMLVNKWGKGKFARKLGRKFRRQKHIPIKRLAAPKSVQGVDWSDHLNYWAFGFSASMLTDTSLYRNPNYHKKSDTIATLDIPKIAKVIDGLYDALIKL